MLNHTYTSVKNANLVDCGKKQHISSQPFPLLRDNFLGEYRTELDKKKVLANLGIATDLSLEWEYIKGDIGRSVALMTELDSRTKYVTQIGEFKDEVITIIEGVKYLESIVGGEQDAEAKQDERITDLETNLKDISESLGESLQDLQDYIQNTVDVNLNDLQDKFEEISTKVDNITSLIQVSTKENNALSLITDENNPGLYVPDLSEELTTATNNISGLQTAVDDISKTLPNFVTKDDLGGGDFDFVNQDDFDSYTTTTNQTLSEIKTDLANTVKTGEDGHVSTLYVKQISKETSDNGENISITNSFEMNQGIPLDVRFVVKSLDELHSLKPSVCYAGMGVIVSNQASLYILREPTNGIIDEEYIKDEEGINWKCPEDLVIEVLTQEEYDKKVEDGETSPHMFYYIHEEVVEEPRREQFESDEAYTEALNKWLRVLQQKYMSAVWGQEIENLVASKASNEAIKSLESEIQRLQSLIDALSGGAGSVNLKDLNTQVSQNTSDIDSLIKEGGTIPTLQTDLSNLKTSVEDNYVTKESITDENSTVQYIFVRNKDFETYKTEHADAIATSITTDKVITTEVAIDNVSVTANEQNDLLINNDRVALSKEVPVIELIDYQVFKDKPIESLEDKYYYVFNDEERYLLQSDFSKYQTQQSNTIRTISDLVNVNKLSIGTLENLSTGNKVNLVLAINEIQGYVSQLSADLGTLTTEEGVITSMQTSINDLKTEISSKYVTIDAITASTEEEPKVNYIFVRNSEFEAYQQQQADAIATSITTEQLNTTELVINDAYITYEDSKLLLGEESIALQSQVPVIEFLSNETFKDKNKEDDVYYYVYDDTDRYILDSEFTSYKTQQNQVTTNLNNGITKNQTSIGDLTTLTTENQNTLVLAINELVSKINALDAEVKDLKQKLGNT